MTDIGGTSRPHSPSASNNRTTIGGNYFGEYNESQATITHHSTASPPSLPSNVEITGHAYSRHNKAVGAIVTGVPANPVGDVLNRVPPPPQALNAYPTPESEQNLSDVSGTDRPHSPLKSNNRTKIGGDYFAEYNESQATITHYSSASPPSLPSNLEVAGHVYSRHNKAVGAIETGVPANTVSEVSNRVLPPRHALKAYPTPESEEYSSHVSRSHGNRFDDYVRAQANKDGDRLQENRVQSPSTVTPENRFMHRPTSPQMATPVSFPEGFNLRTRKFNVAVSFAGEVRPEFVAPMVEELEAVFKSHNYFYDNNYDYALSGIRLDGLLQRIYQNAKLVVVVLSKNYENRAWCRVEWDAIKEKHIFQKMPGDDASLMLLRTEEDVPLPEGLTSLAGYKNIEALNPNQVVNQIRNRFVYMYGKKALEAGATQP